MGDFTTIITYLFKNINKRGKLTHFKIILVGSSMERSLLHFSTKKMPTAGFSLRHDAVDIA